VGGLDGARLVRFLVRLLLAVLVSTGVAGGVAWGWHELAGPDAWWVVTVLGAAVVTTVDLLVFAAAAHAMRLEEVTSVIRAVTRRVPAPGRR
jgi:putative peptidoglycan lipid II flippase